MTKVVFDCNVWDKLALFTEAQNRIRRLCIAGEMEVVVPDTLSRELKESPFQGLPDWFPVRTVPDSVFVLDQSWLDHARLGEGKIYKKHLGDSNQKKDAIIVDTANVDADFFVSDDIRARTRYAAITGTEKSLDFAEFCHRILGFNIKTADSSQV